MKLLTASSVLILATMTGCATHHQARGTARVTSAEKSTFAVARLYEKQRSFDRATAAYLELAAQQPDNYKPLHRLGVISVKQGQLPEGISQLRAAVELAGDDVDVLTDLGYALFLNGEIEAAVESYQSALASKPTNQRTTVNLGLALAQMGRDDQALATLRSVSSSAEAYTSLAYVYSQKGDRQRAEDYFHKAIDEDNRHAPASEGLLQLAKAEQGQSKGNDGNLPQGISVVAVRPVNERLRTAEHAGHTLSDVASGAVKPAGVFEAAVSQSRYVSETTRKSLDNKAANAPIRTVSYERSSRIEPKADHSDEFIHSSPEQAARDSLLTVLQYGGPEAQITAIYDLLNIGLMDRKTAMVIRKLSQSENQEVAEAARDALHIASGSVKAAL